MTVITKRFKKYISPGNLGLSQGKVHCFLKKVPFPEELGPFLKENSFFPKKFVFFTNEIFLFHAKLA
jgi:hypothetical protein